MSKKLIIATENELTVPNKTVVITNNDFVTLARKQGHIRKVFTCHKSDLLNTDLNDEKNWTEFTKDELEKIVQM